jgi:xylulose-5-phosphate/fructose-6-phosphate phosphoketolase
MLATSWHSNKFLNPAGDGAVLPIFDAKGRLMPGLAEPAPTGDRRMGANPHANGGLLLKGLDVPGFHSYAVDVPQPGATDAEATRVMGQFLRDVLKNSLPDLNFRLFSPDENNSNRWQDVFEVTNRAWNAEGGGEPDVVMACCGDVPTLETLAAVDLLRHHAPELKVRVINVVDLMKLQPSEEHPHGLSQSDFDTLFTVDKPIIFAFHGYPWLIHRLTYRRTNHANLHVMGYKEEGTTTTPFDMVVRNDMDRFHLVDDVVNRVSSLRDRATALKEMIRQQLLQHAAYIGQYGEDMPEIRGWRWNGAANLTTGSRLDTAADF